MIKKSFVLNLFLCLILFGVWLHASDTNNKPWEIAGKPTNEKPSELEGIGIDEKLGDLVDLETQFRNEDGQLVALKDYFGKGRPVLLSIVYFNCPSLCNLHLNGLNEAFKQLDWAIGDKFDVISVSMSPSETPDLAKAKKESYIKEYGRSNVDHGWHFLTGDDSQISKLAAQIGFKYKYDQESKEYLHSSAAVVLTPDGKISRYLHGVHFEPKTLRLSLVEASNGQIGEIVDSFMLFCFRYDPNKRTYAFYAYNIMKYGAGLTALALFAFLFPSWKRMWSENKKM